VLQLEKVSRALLADLARRAPLPSGTDTVAFVDMDSMQTRVYGRQKQGAAFGHTKIQWKSLLARGLPCPEKLGPSSLGVRPPRGLRIRTECRSGGDLNGAVSRGTGHRRREGPAGDLGIHSDSTPGVLDGQ
jgi:hypothetical protein